MTIRKIEFVLIHHLSGCNDYDSDCLANKALFWFIYFKNVQYLKGEKQTKAVILLTLNWLPERICTQVTIWTTERSTSRFSVL